MGLKPEYQFPKTWKLDPQRKDLADVMGKFWIHFQNQHIEKPYNLANFKIVYIIMFVLLLKSSLSLLYASKGT